MRIRRIPRPGSDHFRFPPHHRIAVAAGAFYYLMSFTIFRSVILSMPEIMDGSEVVVGDELVPFFNPTSQLLDQAKGEYSELTNGYEFRVRYSFLTTWFRYYKVLPYAVVLVLPTVVWGAYGMVSWFMSRAFKMLPSTTVYLATIFPTSLIYMIMIYAKVTHFYTLVLGLWLMSISAYIMTYALLFRETRWIRLMVISCLVTLMNPAVHYLILFALFLSLSVAILLVGELAKWIRNGGPRRAVSACRPKTLRRNINTSGRRKRLHEAYSVALNSTSGRCVVAMFMLASIAMLPYALFVKYIALRGVPNLSETVPGDYYFIKDASVSLFHILSWDLAGIMDKIKFGDYLAKTPRLPNMIYSLVLFSPLAIGPIRRFLFQTRAHRQLLAVLYGNVGFAIWATVGYGEPTWFPTFHRSMAAFTRAMYATESTPGDLTLALTSTIVQVLRFPHRFQLILFMLAPLILSLPVAWVIERLNAMAIPSRLASANFQAAIGIRLAVFLGVGTVFFLPFFSNAPYRSVYGSGNFGDFFTPYPVEDLQELKQALLERPAGKTVVLPPTETSKLVVGPDDVPHKFIDKFYIYYLDQPSFYYGLTGDKDNKFEFFLLLRGLYYEQDWWVNVMRDIDLDYIVLNKQIQDNRGVGAEYLPGLEAYIREQLDALPKYVDPVFENESFVLYELTDPARPERDILLFDTSWKGFLDTVFARLDLSACYNFEYISSYRGSDSHNKPVNLLATDPHSAAVDLWAVDNGEYYFTPSSKIFAFNSDVVASSYYLSPMFRLFLFFSDTKWNRNEMITPGIFGTLRGSFIGLPRPTRFTVPTTVPQTGTYRVLMRSAVTANSVRVRSTTLGYDEHFELRAQQGAQSIFASDRVYEQDRVPVDISMFSTPQLESQIPGDLVPINLRYVYIDLGAIDVAAGNHTFIFDKSDANPMLVEGLVLVPEDIYQTIDEQTDFTLVESVADLECSQVSKVRTGVSDGVEAVANEAKADLTQEDVLELLGANELVAPPVGGLGGREYHLIVSGLILVGCFGLVRWRIRRTIDPE